MYSVKRIRIILITDPDPGSERIQDLKKFVTGSDPDSGSSPTIDTDPDRGKLSRSATLHTLYYRSIYLLFLYIVIVSICA